MQSVVVTGVSTGIGWGITKVLIGHGFRVFGSVRNAQDAERLSKEFGKEFIPLSVGGKFGGPFLGAYAAAKHGLEGFSESLRRELMLYEIDVIIVGPGSVATPIWDKAEHVDLSMYSNTEYVEAARRVKEYMIRNGRNGYPPEKVGEVVWQALTTPRPRVRYAVIPGSSWRRILQRLLPKRLIDRIIAKNLGFK